MKMAMKARMMLMMAPRVMSSATEGPTFCEEMMLPPARSSRLMKFSSVRSSESTPPFFRASKSFCSISLSTSSPSSSMR